MQLDLGVDGLPDDVVIDLDVMFRDETTRLVVFLHTAAAMKV